VEPELYASELYAGWGIGECAGSLSIVYAVLGTAQ
jgi:hypothetical protein